ncbi:methyl-CpG-binding domain-containing protein 4 [Phlyctema vagabunda]|uniref:Methyl-CpG-binding domain-containing protein 4 n=1 Tax=Phlyctema vagabunda TaxID=108571 RepID=A0ABR4P3N1_9HELO
MLQSIVGSSSMSSGNDIDLTEETYESLTPVLKTDSHQIPELDIGQNKPYYEKEVPAQKRSTDPPKLNSIPDIGSSSLASEPAVTRKSELTGLEFSKSTTHTRVLRSASKAKKAPARSPYFTPPVSPLKKERASSAKEGGSNGVDEKKLSPQKPSPSKRSPGGIISCIPFPPLSAPYFGLIQEKLASDPFRLLIAVTFLIRTHGKHAIPVFYELMEKYPTPESLVDANKEDIVPIIRHLGLQNQRAGTYKTYAQIWLDKTPCKGVRYPVRDYPTRGDGRNVQKSEVLDDSDERPAWEIGHMTQGPYAIDSWRIFCRDVCRGLAQDWNGKGSEEGFQPEWMRVLPQDKELRAYLRWMWLKEGFEWDPFTGDKQVASQALMRAAIEGRIAWDDRGGMRIIGEGDAIISDLEVRED